MYWRIGRSRKTHIRIRLRFMQYLPARCVQSEAGMRVRRYEKETLLDLPRPSRLLKLLCLMKPIKVNVVNKDHIHTCPTIEGEAALVQMTMHVLHKISGILSTVKVPRHRMTRCFGYFDWDMGSTTFKSVQNPTVSR